MNSRLALLLPVCGTATASEGMDPLSAARVQTGERIVGLARYG
jgi:hypothetical protein